MKNLSVVAIEAIFITLGLGLKTQQAQAYTLFNDRATFQNQLSTFIVDNYENPGYFTGDIFDQEISDVHSNASINRVIGETRYQTTTGSEVIFGYPIGTGYNVVFERELNHFYCAGCTGSFLLDFTQTSVGNALGVFGVGFDILFNTDYVAHVTFGNNNEQDFALGNNNEPDFSLAGSRFFGITSDVGVKSIHVGLANGQPTLSGHIEIDNLTIGSRATTVPEPTFILGLLAVSAFGNCSMQKRKNKLAPK
jgi:hypothetical protein